MKDGPLIYQLMTVMYWITVATTDNEESGFISERAHEKRRSRLRLAAGAKTSQLVDN